MGDLCGRDADRVTPRMEFGTGPNLLEDLLRRRDRWRRFRRSVLSHFGHDDPIEHVHRLGHNGARAHAATSRVRLRNAWRRRINFGGGAIRRLTRRSLANRRSALPLLLIDAADF